MESSEEADYQKKMANRDLGALLGGAFKDIRTARRQTQQRWAQATGIPQSTMSDIERGRTTFDAVRSLGEALERAGVDPIELFRVALARAGEIPEEDQQLVTELLICSPEDRLVIRRILRAGALERATGREQAQEPGESEER